MVLVGAGGTNRPQIRVLGCFDVVVDGMSVAARWNVQRVLAFLAVADRPQRREVLADRLWATSAPIRAQAYLRNALWQIRLLSPRLVHATRNAVQLGPDVDVDLAASRSLAHQFLDGHHTELVPLAGAAALLERVLLPSWDEDWLMLERERTRQLHLHALEALSHSFVARGEHARAIETAFAAVVAEPLRESARVVLIEAYLAEGNRCEALRELANYRQLLHVELGLQPSPELDALVMAAPPARTG